MNKIELINEEIDKNNLTEDDLFWIRSSLIKRKYSLKNEPFIKVQEEIEKLKTLIDKLDFLLKDMYK